MAVSDDQGVLLLTNSKKRMTKHNYNRGINGLHLDKAKQCNIQTRKSTGNISIYKYIYTT